MSRSYEFGITCENCGTLFDASRQDAKCCSAKCRLDVSRRKKRNAKKLEAYNKSVTDMAQMWRDFDSQTTFEFLCKAVSLLTKARDNCTND